MRRLFTKFSHPVRGLIHALKDDIGFQSQAIGGFIVLALATYFLQPLQPWEILFVALTYALILITEMQNSALEEALDEIHPEHQKNIGHSKDMAAAAVLLAGFFAAGVLLLLILVRM